MIFVETNPKNQLEFYRATGLTVDPNSLGLLGTIFTCFFFSVLLSRSKANFLTLVLSALFGVCTIIISGSRTAFVALICLVVLALFVDTIRQNRFSLVSKSTFIVLMLLFFIVSVAIASYFAPPLVERISAALSPSAGGLIADVNFFTRVQLWKVCPAYLYGHPFGTLVPPFYALDMTIDSYWVYVVTQGSLPYLLAFVLFILGMVNSGLALIKSDVAMTKFIGYFTLLLILAACVESITMVAFLEPSVIFLMFALIGITAYSRNKATA